MKASHNQGPTQVHQARTVQLEPHDACPTCWCQPNHQCGVGAPDEMAGPRLEPRVVQPNPQSCHRIDGFECCVFAVVASLAGHRQVLEGICAACRTWRDVFHREVIVGEIALTLAVFAATSSPFKNVCANFVGCHAAVEMGFKPSSSRKV